MLNTFITVFTTVFLAEIGDKTQLATVLFAAEPSASKWTVFFSASAALVLAAGIGVLAGDFLGKVISPQTLKTLAGIGFIAVGVWTIVSR